MRPILWGFIGYISHSCLPGRPLGGRHWPVEAQIHSPTTTEEEVWRK